MGDRGDFFWGCDRGMIIIISLFCLGVRLRGGGGWGGVSGWYCVLWILDLGGGGMGWGKEFG